MRELLAQGKNGKYREPDHADQRALVSVVWPGGFSFFFTADLVIVFKVFVYLPANLEKTDFNAGFCHAAQDQYRTNKVEDARSYKGTEKVKGHLGFPTFADRPVSPLS